MLRRMAEDGKPDYFACVFDAKGKTFRDDWYSAVQGQPRRRCRTTSSRRSSRCTRWCARLAGRADGRRRGGRRRHRHAGAGRPRPRHRHVISTGDKDLAQLVNEHVTLVNTMSNETLDEAGVEAKFGVRAGPDPRLPRRSSAMRSTTCPASTRSGRRPRPSGSRNTARSTT